MILNNIATLVKQPPILEGKVSDNCLAQVQNYCNQLIINEDIQTTKAYNLAGNIKHQYLYNNTENELLDIIEQTAYHYHKLIGNKFQQLWIDDLWVNFQSKYEYIPPHSHGGYLTFVFYVKVPYDLEIERLHSPRPNASINNPGDLYFHLYDLLGNLMLVPYNVSKDHEGKFILFDSKIMHGVFPFYHSNDYRIVIIGNIYTVETTSKSILY